MASGHGPGADRGLMGVRGKGGTRQARLSAADRVADPLRAARDESEGYLDQRAAPCIQSDSTQAVPMLPRATVAQSSSEELHSTSPVYPSWDDN